MDRRAALCRWARWAGGLGFLAGGGAWVPRALAQAAGDSAAAWPDKPVRIVVPTAAGSGSDLLTRALAQRLAQAWKQPVNVENKAGASGILGVDAVVRAPADGLTLLMSSSSPVLINPMVFKKLPHDPLKQLVPVSHVGIGPAAMLVNEATPARTLAEYIAHARTRPAPLSYGSFGMGSGGHLGMAALCQLAGIEMTHVPYKGTAPAVTDLLGGQISTVLTDLATAHTHIRSGKLRALAINGPTRSPLLPDVPTFTEQGFPGMEGTFARFALFAPTGTPTGVVARIAADTTAALEAAELRERFVSLGYTLYGSTPAELTLQLRDDTERWRRVITALGGLSLDS